MSTSRSFGTAARQLHRIKAGTLARPDQLLVTRPFIASIATTNGIQSRRSIPSTSCCRTVTGSSSKPFSTLRSHRKENQSSPDLPSGLPPPRSYTFDEISDLSLSPSPNRILIDVREPSELLATGRIPGALSIPISSSPDAFFLSAEDFEDRFGFARPGEQDEVIFYCKAGVRSRQAALLAGQARPMFGGKQGKYDGSWLEWESKGGKVEREGDAAAARSDVSAAGDQAKGRP